MRKLWKSLSFSIKLKLGRLTITIRFEPSAAAAKRKAAAET